MRVQKITLKFRLLAALLCMTTVMMAQNTPTVTVVAPTNATYRTTMNITGTNFGTATSVNFYVSGTTGTTVPALSTTVNSSTSLTVVVPAVVASGGAAATKYLSISKIVSGTTYTSTAISYTYTPPAHTPANAVVDRIITNYNGYWSSGIGGTSGYATSNVQPDNQHSLMAFKYGTTLYSTGSEAAITNVLGSNAGTGAYTAGDWRAIPVNNIAGNNPGAQVYLVLGSLIDGSATQQIHTAPSVQGLSARDVLIDGVRGLGLGTGITNLPSTSPLSFTAGNILENKAGDEIPDILVTQVADPTQSSFTTYCFTDAAGNIVGVPVEINMYSVARLGIYKSDFFTLQTQAFNTAVVNGTGTPGGTTREIRMLAYKLSDFGITETNRTSVTQFKVLTNGTDDMAFMAYNRQTFIIPAPEITGQPLSQAVCPADTATFSVTVSSVSSGTETNTYQWEKNGIALTNGGRISGATSPTLTITNITATDYAIYRCVVSNSVGAAFSNSAYLNSVFLTTTTSAATCLNTATTLEATAVGNTPQYQWYTTANNGTSTSTADGSAISGATGTTYSPSVATAGTKYYYVQAYPQGKACAPATSAAIPVTVYSTSSAGTISASQSICTGNTATVSITGNTGAIQWQSSANNSTWADISGANAANYTTPALTATMYYRANVTNGTCGAATSSVSTVTVSPASVAGTTSADQTICVNNTATISLNGYTGTIQWQESANGTTGWANVTGGTGATTATYTTAALTATKYYKAVVTSGACSTATSATVKVTVNAAAVAGTVSENQTVCSGTSTSVSVSGYSGSIQWQKSADNNIWSDVNGAVAATLTTPVLTATTYYRATVSSGVCNAATTGVVTVTVNTTYTWLGTTSVNWNTASNWSCNLIPTNVVDVVIPASAPNQPTVNNDGTAHARTLNVNEGAALKVATGGTIQVVNEVTVATTGSFVVENNGALVQDNEAVNNGIITVKRDSNPLYRLDYTLWSSPVAGQQLLSFSQNTSATRFYEYKYALNTSGVGVEGYWSVDAATSFTAAKGFLIRMPNADNTPGYNAGTTTLTHHGVFTGTPFNGTIEVPMSVENNRFTATGNPYASPINIEAFFAANAGKLETGTGIYLWRKKNDAVVSSYVTVTLAGFTANNGTVSTTGSTPASYANGGQEQAGYFSGNRNTWTLSQGQGFIVKTAAGLTNPKLTFNNGMRVAVPQTNGQAFLREAANTTSRLWLNLTNTANAFSQAAVAYIDGATTALDYGFDGKSIADAASVSVYTVAADTKLSIQARPGFEATDIVQLGYNATTAGTYTLTLDHVDGIFAQYQKIYLKDKVEGITREISSRSYSFTTEAGVFNDRFEVTYTNGVTAGVDNPTAIANTVMVYKDGNNINITTGTAEMTSVNVYDIHGRKLYSNAKVNGTDTVITGLMVQQQLIIVEVNTVKGSVSKKVLY
ncbi:beta strand repeat-containing protein [Flavobacterium psychrotrophum]|uniref:beta strand repeat-containing protein n=1 Tax=Flavobacterium psychrotrophum TaxID=2294119 RepID=UPI0013C40B54|nr:immunoglobulin domain-containing protein [Flavobacterium psychrotrophum]